MARPCSSPPLPPSSPAGHGVKLFATHQLINEGDVDQNCMQGTQRGNALFGVLDHDCSLRLQARVLTLRL